MEPKSKGIFIQDEEYSFQESTHLFARAISLIVDEDDGAIFSMIDILCLLRSVNEYVPGEFQIQRIHPHYHQIVYKSEDEVIEGFKERWEGFI